VCEKHNTSSKNSMFTQRNLYTSVLWMSSYKKPQAINVKEQLILMIESGSSDCQLSFTLTTFTDETV